MTILDPHLFRPTLGFMKTPAGVGLDIAHAAILGMPFDCGADPYRIGARQGPGAIRDQAIRLDGPYPSFSMRNPLKDLAVMDCGDANVISGRIEEAFEVMESAVNHIADSGAIPVTMGGDGAVIDGIGPDGLAAATRELARRAGRLQSGYVYHYAFAMLIGVAALVSWYLFQQTG